MARWFTEEEVRRMIAEAVAEAVAPLKARILELEAEVARLKKNSSTSSKPPSGDIVKPPRPLARDGKRGMRRAGGQPRHPRHTRPPFPPEQVDRSWDYEWEVVPMGWKPLDRFQILQQVELVDKPFMVTEHRARLYQNLRTGQVLAVPLPREVRRAGLLAKIKTLFRVWHRRGQMNAGRWARAAADARREVLAVARRAPTTSEALNMAKRFRDHGDQYFTFLDTPDIEPTNNGPERQIRFLAIDRKITQGTRGESGRRWCERIWTVLATCARQNRSAFEFIHRSILADFTNQPFPSLLPLPP